MNWSMMRSALCLALAISIGGACSTKTTSCFKEQLLALDSLIVQHEYAEAIARTEALLEEHPADTALLSCVTKVKKYLRYQEAKYMLVDIDERLKRADRELDSLSNRFILKHNSDYNTVPRYLHRSMEAMESWRHPHLRLLLSEQEVSFISVYVGGKPINHEAMRIKFAHSGESYETPAVAYDKALNYRYNDGDLYHEFVNYSQEQGLALITFMREYLTKGEKPQVELLAGGKVVARISFALQELMALQESLDLAKLLSDKKELMVWQGVYATRFARLDAEVKE